MAKMKITKDSTLKPFLALRNPNELLWALPFTHRCKGSGHRCMFVWSFIIYVSLHYLYLDEELAIIYHSAALAQLALLPYNDVVVEHCRM